jgi:hypothetical protein
MRFDGATCTETIRPSSEARCVREIVIRPCRGRIPRQKHIPTVGIASHQLVSTVL